MANTVNNAPEEQSLEKVVWGYVGTGVLWISLVLTGLAFERLGLSSNIFSGILPGEVGALRGQMTECTRDLGVVKNDRDTNKLTEGALRVEIEKLKKQLTAAPAPTDPAPTDPTPTDPAPAAPTP
jgi:hypothetical protein